MKRKMEEHMVEKVNELLDKYNGGTIFFDELDNAIRLDEEVIDSIYKMIEQDHDLSEVKIVASGKTGYKIRELGYRVDLLVCGGLRNGDIPDEYDWLIDEYCDYVFIDDSYFLGRTEAAIEEILSHKNAELVDTYVAYDGCICERPWVHSLYRYYDFHDRLGRKL